VSSGRTVPDAFVPTTAGDIAFGVNGFCHRNRRYAGQHLKDGVPWRIACQGEAGIRFPPFSRALDPAARRDFFWDKNQRDHDASILSDRKRRVKVDRVSRLGAGVDKAVLKPPAYPRS